MLQELEPGAFDASKFFGDRSSYRIIFLRKVYGLLTLQLLHASYWIGWSMTDQKFQDFLTEKWGIAVGTLTLQFIILLVVFFGRSIFRKLPVGIFTYIIFTYLLAYNLSYLSVRTNAQIVLMVVALACFLTFALLIYALTTKFDLTYLGGAIYVLGSTLFGFEIFLIASDIQVSIMIYTSLANIIFGFYLIYDTQFIIIGQSLNSEMESSLVGSIVVYMDIILIFFRLIQLLGRLFKQTRHQAYQSGEVLYQLISKQYLLKSLMQQYAVFHFAKNQYQT